MIDTGMIRTLDPLGRIVIPSELRKSLQFDDKEPLRIWISQGVVNLQPLRFADQSSTEPYVERETDTVGRLVLPITIRSTFGLKPKDKLLLLTGKDGLIALKKYVSPSACVFCRSAGATKLVLGQSVCGDCLDKLGHILIQNQTGKQETQAAS